MRSRLGGSFLVFAWFVFSLACPAPASAQGVPAQEVKQIEEKLNAENSAIVETRQKVIKKENARSNADEWAGEYYYGDGLGVNVRLLFSPTSGFAYTWHGCLGLYDQNYGDVQQKPGRVRLLPKLANNRRGFGGIAEEFYEVRWGPRHYLVSTDGVIDFANAVNAGTEPRANNSSSSFLLKRGDETRKAIGIPAIPVEYADYLLRQPLEAQISSVGRVHMEDGERFDTVTIGIGLADGVRKGMEFFVVRPVLGSGSVTKVSEHECELELRQYDLKPQQPSSKWKLSTRMH